MYDANPDIFQLFNCVVDLQTNTIRKGTPADRTSRRSQIVIPEAWLKDPSLIDAGSAAMCQEAWDIIWSMFTRGEDGQPHPLDEVETLGDQDVNNCEYLMRLMARKLEGRPICKCEFLFSPRGRNSKGVIEKIYQSVWGEYFVPVKASCFYADKRSESKHSAVEMARFGARVGFGNETSSTPWSNGVFKFKKTVAA